MKTDEGEIFDRINAINKIGIGRYANPSRPPNR